MLPTIAQYLADHQLPLTDFTLRLFSPGRINLIGEHTDYTGGWVMPAAIDKGIEFYARPRPGQALYLHAVDLDERAHLPLPVTGKSGKLWVDYLAGVVAEFQGLGHALPGLEIVFGGNVPPGSGMSSSAALEGGMAFLLNEVTGAGLSRPELALLCQRSSNNFIGVPTGIMDQFASLNGSAAGPILLNCASLEFSALNASLPGYEWLLVNSLVTHELGSSEYPVRVRECAAAFAAVKAKFPGVANLSSATPHQFATVAATLPPTIQRRGHYVVNENERVKKMATALQAGDAAAAGQLLNATHAGLRDNYEVSCAEVDFLQEQATQVFGGEVAGARIMGGGFGGCTINLVRSAAVPALQTFLRQAYREAYGKEPEFYPVKIGPGTHLR